MIDDIEAALELAEDQEEFKAEADQLLEQVNKDLNALEIESLLREKTDTANALLTINAAISSLGFIFSRRNFHNFHHILTAATVLICNRLATNANALAHGERDSPNHSN